MKCNSAWRRRRTRPTRARRVVSPTILWGRACRRGRACAGPPRGCPAGLPLRPLQTLGANNTKRTLHSQAKKPKFTHISLGATRAAGAPLSIAGFPPGFNGLHQDVRAPDATTPGARPGVVAWGLAQQAITLNPQSSQRLPPSFLTHQRSWNLHHCPSSCTQVSSR